LQGIIHSIETGGTVDGPGIRFVLFLAGCPLRCLYCHNPDTHDPNRGEKKTVGDLLEEIACYKDFFTRSHGGVTASGGEPLMQAEFVTALFRGCKNMGIHTSLDTSGYLGAKATDELLSVTDLVLLDIKSFDPENYRKVTGVMLQPTLDYAERLARMKIPIWARFVLVPGLTDDFAMIERMADYLAKLGNVERVEVLPFHKMGEPKWKALGLTYALKDTLPPSAEVFEKVKGIFAIQGLAVG